MYKVMLVDDEYFAREAMKASIPWEEYDCTICAEAKNGQDGLEKARNTVPDIVISDINMPILNGLDMIETLQKEFPDTVFAVITGYSEFEYAKRAIDLGLRYFIMKPMDTDRILSVVQEMTGSLEESRSRNLEYRSLRFWAALNSKESRSKFLELLLLQKNSITPARFQYECRHLEIPLETGGYAVVTFKIDSRTYVRMTQTEWQSLINSFMGEDNRDWKYVSHYAGAGDLYLIFHSVPREKWDNVVISPVLQKIQLGFLQKWVCTVLMGIGTWCETYDMISDSCESAELTESEVKVSSLISDVLQLIHRNYSDPELSVKSISDSLYVNYSYLSAQFSKEMGMSASHYISRFRMTKAVDVLRTGNDNMVHIATSVGYTDIKYFYRVFKREFGMTPYQCAELLKDTRSRDIIL